MFMDYYQKSVQANSKFAPGYLALYEQWAQKDVNKAQEYLEQFVNNADKDREIDYFRGDYLFRAGKYTESLKIAEEIKSGLNGEKYAKVNKLFAFNYDRLKDSIKAMQAMEAFMAEQEDENKVADDYAMMAAQYLKVPGNLEKAELNAEKAVSMDTSVAGKVAIMDKLIGAYGAQQNFAGQFKWMKRKNELKPDNSARNLFFMIDAAHKAKLYNDAVAMASQYITTFPDQVQGYSLKVRSAMAADPDTSKGTAIEALDQYSTFMMSDTAKYRKRIINNHGYKIYYYFVKAQDFAKALESANDILKLEPTNEYALGAKAEAERFIKAAAGKGAAAVGTKPAGTGGNTPKAPEPRK